MTGYTIGVLLLVIVFGLVYFGLAHRVLDRLYLSDRAALALIVAMIVGSFINIPITSGRVVTSVNVGGGLIPFGLAIYVLYRAGTAREVGRALLGAVITAAVLFGISLVTRGREAWNVSGLSLLDPLYYYPLIAGVVAYLVGRSRRAAFVGAILGVLLLDVVDLFFYLSRGLRGTVAFGGAGIIDVTFMAAVVAVLLAELIGEVRERVQGGPETTGHSRSLLSSLQGPSLKPLTANKPDTKDNGGEQGE
ncbi:DUF1614 domain-containing protein [Neomoorella mulderi]|uniref:DUF1614 domain-containing protein n=1 Tax=Moorella mulderi DSM 14980 TaxID=1122241 RepID=A0A151AZJ0_9FIRM|nr:DUF1614 domain-containing protein [Moorella mulderi]KYH33046.1 hypothetical protein MOMUL_08240 [Moorella mulderi DSM 14980]